LDEGVLGKENGVEQQAKKLEHRTGIVSYLLMAYHLVLYKYDTGNRLAYFMKDPTLNFKFTGPDIII
jgi:hypothetical protein